MPKSYNYIGEDFVEIYKPDGTTLPCHPEYNEDDNTYEAFVLHLDEVDGIDEAWVESTGLFEEIEDVPEN